MDTVACVLFVLRFLSTSLVNMEMRCVYSRYSQIKYLNGIYLFNHFYANK